MKLAALLAVSCLAVAPAALAEPAALQISVKPYSLARSEQFDVTSKINGRAYRIFVHTPALPPPPGGYPVLYVTDGNATFPIAAGQAEINTLIGGQVMVVGIGYQTQDVGPALALRNRDLTPSKPTTSAPGEKPDDYGGAEDFYRFITEELRPTLAGTYKVDPKDQTLYGHSLGGLFTLGVLFRHPDAFKGYAISSPSIWWNNREVLKGEAAFKQRVEAGQIAPRILVSVGGLEEDLPNRLPPGMSLVDAKREFAKGRMVHNARELAQRLSKIKGRPGFEVRSQVFEAETHTSTMAASLSRALTLAEGY